MRIMMILLLGTLLSACQSASSSSSLPRACTLKPESGKCRAAHTRYWFDADSRSCRAFIWGGCEGVVPFETLEQCQQTCPVEAESDTGTEQKAAPLTRPIRGY
jgi:hypothetical protein